MNNKTTRNSLLLLVTAAVWGAALWRRQLVDRRSERIHLIVSAALSVHWC